jgi:acyl carrier protein
LEKIQKNNKNLQMNDIESRLKKTFSNVFNVEINSINNDSSPDDINSWDSINHMNLIIAIEREFNIQFDEEDIAILLSYEIIRETLTNIL